MELWPRILRRPAYLAALQGFAEDRQHHAPPNGDQRPQAPRRRSAVAAGRSPAAAVRAEPVDPSARGISGRLAPAVRVIDTSGAAGHGLCAELESLVEPAETGTGNGKQRRGQGTGNREQGTGDREAKRQRRNCRLSTAHCLPPAAGCPLPTAHCPLPIATNRSLSPVPPGAASRSLIGRPSPGWPLESSSTKKRPTAPATRSPNASGGGRPATCRPWATSCWPTTRRLIAAAGLRGAVAGSVPFHWQTDFDFLWLGGWAENQDGQVDGTRPAGEDPRARPPPRRDYGRPLRHGLHGGRLPPRPAKAAARDWPPPAPTTTTPPPPP